MEALGGAAAYTCTCTRAPEPESMLQTCAKRDTSAMSMVIAASFFHSSLLFIFSLLRSGFLGLFLLCCPRYLPFPAFVPVFLFLLALLFAFPSHAFFLLSRPSFYFCPPFLFLLYFIFSGGGNRSLSSFILFRSLVPVVCLPFPDCLSSFLFPLFSSLDMVSSPGNVFLALQQARICFPEFVLSIRTSSFKRHPAAQAILPADAPLQPSSRSCQTRLGSKARRATCQQCTRRLPLPSFSPLSSWPLFFPILPFFHFSLFPFRLSFLMSRPFLFISSQTRSLFPATYFMLVMKQVRICIPDFVMLFQSGPASS